MCKGKIIPEKATGLRGGQWTPNSGRYTALVFYPFGEDGQILTVYAASKDDLDVLSELFPEGTATDSNDDDSIDAVPIYIKGERTGHASAHDLRGETSSTAPPHAHLRLNTGDANSDRDRLQAVLDTIIPDEANEFIAFLAKNNLILDEVSESASNEDSSSSSS